MATSNDMGVNKALPHVHVLPEDDANRQLALGFFLEISPQRSSQIKILPVAGGWTKVRDSFFLQTRLVAWKCGPNAMSSC